MSYLKDLNDLNYSYMSDFCALHDWLYGCREYIRLNENRPFDIFFDDVNEIKSQRNP